MKKLKKPLLILFSFSFYAHGFSQTEINYARTPRQLGWLVAAPGIVNDKIKLGFVYKERGDTTRFRGSINFVNFPDPELGTKDIELYDVNDSSAHYRFWYNESSSFDLRLGLEKRSFCKSCFFQEWFGAELMAGIHRTKTTYWHKTQYLLLPGTSSNAFFPSPGAAGNGFVADGIRKSDYVKAGASIFHQLSFRWIENLSVDIRSSIDFIFNVKMKDHFVSDTDHIFLPDKNVYFEFNITIIELGINFVFRN